MDPFTLLATTALSGGLSFLSGSGQRRAAQRQERLQIWETQRVEQVNRETAQNINNERNRIGNLLASIPALDIDAFRAAGNKLGYNPVTWLNSGALSLFQPRAQAEAAYKMMLPDAQATATPMTFQRIPDAMEVLGNAGLSALNTFTSGYKTMTAQNMQQQMFDKQLSLLSSRGANTVGTSREAGFSNPMLSAVIKSVGGLAGAARGLSARPRGKKDAVSDVAYPQSWERGKVEVTNPHYSWVIDKKEADAETYETRYGDVVQELFGAYNLVNDGLKSASGKSFREWGEAFRAMRQTKHSGAFVPRGMSADLAMPAWAPR